MKTSIKDRELIKIILLNSIIIFDNKTKKIEKVKDNFLKYTKYKKNIIECLHRIIGRYFIDIKNPSTMVYLSVLILYENLTYDSTTLNFDDHYDKIIYNNHLKTHLILDEESLIELMTLYDKNDNSKESIEQILSIVNNGFLKIYDMIIKTK